MVHESHFDGSKWSDDDIVISGISARLPNCDTVEEFQENLLAKVDLITDEPRRFQNGLYGAIKRYGLLKDLSKFDAKFFSIHPNQAERMDPQIRNLLEVAYEATVDAGLHPEDLKGTKTGVVVGVASSETQDKWSQMPDRINGYEYTGCTRTMFANRLSHFLDIKGPSYSIDTASSTTLVAFQQAYDMIKDGVCDSCFVCGTDLVLNPCVCLMFQCLNMLSPEGKCKAFDISGDGYVRSEGVVAVLLQKAKTAKRIYANVLAAGSNCDGYKDEGITFPSGPQQVKLFRKVAQLAGIDPSTIDFMEAHGSATRVGDPQEMNAVTEVFANGRKEPLRTGSIKSNMGHGEPASALSAVIKICVAMECGIIPPNLHYNVPNPDIPALLDGRLNVITEPTPWDGGLVAVNSFGVGGANGHALLLSNKKVKQNLPQTIPRLICVSGVTKQAVQFMLKKIQALPFDPELYALLDNIHRKNIKGHEFRGYTVLHEDNTLNVESIDLRANFKLAIILPGVEIKWKSIGDDLLALPVFQNAIKNCEKELKSVSTSMKLTSILKNLNNEKSALNVIVGVTALQIALIDLLRSLNLVPDYIIGVNVGEIAAGYADNAYTLQQAILISYHVGNAVQPSHYPSTMIKTNLPRIFKYPADVSVYAKISSSCTYVSGSAPSLEKFITMVREKEFQAFEMKSTGIDTAGILRSSGIQSKLATNLKKILATSNEPSKKWLTSAVQTKSHDCLQHLISSLSEPSPIHKALARTAEATFVQIGFDSSIDNPSKNISSAYFSLLNESTAVLHTLSTVGQIYIAGFQPQIQNLYPKIQFPVSHRTPMIQSLIEWDHSQKWNVVSFAPKDGRTAGEMDVVVDFDKEEFNFLPKNYVNAKEVFPKSFYVKLLQRVMSRLQNKPESDIPLVVENLFFHQETSIPDDGPVKFTVNIIEISKKFEIRVDGNVVASGHVYIPADVKKERIPERMLNADEFSDTDLMLKNDIYKHLSVEQYQYNETFKQLESSNETATMFKTSNSNWCAFLEAFVQIAIFCSTFAENSHPVVSYIRKIVIDPRTHAQNKPTTIKYHKKWNILRGESVEVRGVKLKMRPSIIKSKAVLSYYDFIPFNSNEYENAMEASLMVTMENWAGHTDLKVVEVINPSSECLLSTKLQTANPSASPDITVCSAEACFVDCNDEFQNIKIIHKDIAVESVDNNCHIIIASNIMNHKEAFNNLINSVRTNGCILLEENLDENFGGDENLECISILSSHTKTYFVLKKVPTKIQNTPRVVTVSNLHECTQKLNQIPDENTLIIAKDLEIGGVIKYVKNVMEEKNLNLRAIFIEDKNAPLFSFCNPVYANQLKKNFPINVLKNGIWGTYTTLSLQVNNVPANEAHIGLEFNNDTTDVGLVQTNADMYKQLKNPWNVTCQVHFASIIGRDYELFKGGAATPFSLPDYESQKYHLGAEFSGYQNEKKVFGLVAGGALSTSVIADTEFLWEVSDSWTLEESCTVPGAFIAAYYCLSLRGNLKPENSLLIIGDDVVSMAAIRIALHLNCKLFVLVADVRRKAELMKLLPHLNTSQIIVSSSDNFYLEILQKTSGKGVDIAFVTLPKPSTKFQSYVSALAENGKCIYINKGRQTDEETLGSNGNMRCITFYRFHPSTFFDPSNCNNNLILRKKIHELVAEGLRAGVVKPLPYSLHSLEEINHAFESVFQDKSSKVIVNLRNVDVSNRSPMAKSMTFMAKPRTYFDNKQSYIILGGYEEFGTYVVNWMVAHGAKMLIFVSTDSDPRPQNQPLFQLCSSKWRNSNCTIANVKTRDFNAKNCENIVQKAMQSGPVGGIFDLMEFKICQDDLPCTPSPLKIDFLVNMDTATRKMCPNLQFFVSFSGLACNDSGCNYANGVMQDLIKNRREMKLCGTFIQWGPIGESATEIIYNASYTNIPPQPVNSCLKTLHRVMQSPRPNVISYISSLQGNDAAESKVDAIMEGVAKFLGIKDPSTVLPNLTMLELGLDSLIGTDIQQFLEINYGVTMCTQEIRELTFAKLKNLAETL